MNFTLLQRPRGAAVTVSGWRLPVQQVSKLMDAAQLAGELQRLLDEADERLARAEADGRRIGRAEGEAEGRRISAETAAAATADLINECKTELAAQRADLGALAIQVVRKVAAAIGPQGMLEAVAEHAVCDLLGDAPLVIHVAVSTAAGVRERLAGLGEVEVVADATLTQDDCVLVSSRGSVLAGLPVQLAALERAFTQAAR